jgi:hypothetical protein
MLVSIRGTQNHGGQIARKAQSPAAKKAARQKACRKACGQIGRHAAKTSGCQGPDESCHSRYG